MALTDDGRPICGSCGATRPARRTLAIDGTDPHIDAFGTRALTAAEHETRARAAGWRIGQLPNGTHDAMCNRCARPDPDLVRICRELTRP